MSTLLPNAIVTPDQDAVVCEVEIAAPAEKIFQALTSSDMLMQWWNGEGGPCQVDLWEIEPRVGGRMRHAAHDPTGQMKVNGVSEFKIEGEVTECDPPRVLAYTWRANFHPNPKHDTLVRWELTPRPGGTHVKVTHSRLSAIAQGPGYAEGWPGVVAALSIFAEA
jgi:uncharacterized protein YndB with AHSA1/START domain